MPAPALAGAQQSRRCPAADLCSCSRAGLASRLLLLANRRSRPANALRPGLSAKEGRGTRALLSRETRAPIRSVAGARPRTARPVSQLARRRANAVRRLAPAFVSPQAFRAATLAACGYGGERQSRRECRLGDEAEAAQPGHSKLSVLASMGPNEAIGGQGTSRRR